MKFEIENVNAVKNASILLDGLTVIVGENSSGKSTVARALFSTIKALNESEKTEKEYRVKKIKKNIDILYKRLYDAKIEDLDIFAKIKEEFPLPNSEFFDRLIFSDDPYKFLEDKWNFVKQLDIIPRIKKLLGGDLQKIMIDVNEPDRRWLFAAEIQTLLETEFINNISQTDESPSKVRFEMDDQNVLEYTIKDSQLDKFSFNGNSFIKDATYIESPLYLHILDSLLQSQPYNETLSKKVGYKAMIPTHIIDFVNKIDSIKYNNRQQKLEEDDLKIEEITEGHFFFDENAKKIVFTYNGKNISPINVASGVKTFGTIQMLWDAEYINEDKMLFWDEPENHLHPAWQLEFASILVQLSKNGVPILITTHSPYFLQAIRFYSAKFGVEKYVNYYTSKKVDSTKLSEFKCVNDNLNDVFTTLAEPLNRILNIDEVRKENK